MTFQKISKSIQGFFKTEIPNFFNKTFDISYTLSSKIIGCSLCIITLIGVILCINTYSSLAVSTRWLLMAFDLLLPFAIAFCTVFTVRVKSEKAKRISGFVILFLMPVITMSITECLNNVFIYNMTYLGFLGNYLVILIIYFLFFAVSGSFKITYLVTNSLLFGLAVAHSYIMDFRGTPFQPMDFLSVTTAANVANTYDFTPNYKVITASLLFILLTVICIKMKTPKYSLITKIISRSFTLTFSSVILILFYFTSLFADMGVKPDFWNQTRGYHNYGFVFNFFANTKYLYVTEPNNYDSEQIDEIINRQDDNSDNTETSKTPNIICIMNESLSDLSALGEFETNKDYMPFLHSLTKNTIKGNLYVPVIGAGTSNTEFEFLTGHTTAFLPSGSNAYMLYIKNATPSLVSTLKAQKYSSFALHPYYASGWRRTAVYSNFGFDKFISLENIMDVSLMTKYQQNGNDANYLQSLIDEYYPNSDMLIRQYVSDSYNYKLLIKDYEKRDKSKPYFAFNVTMQNHGGYTNSCVNFPEKIKLTSSEKSEKYIKTNKYLSLVKQSDSAFKELIEYFSNVKEKTVICMFGDHQPNIETEFVAETLGVDNLSNLTIEQEQSRHVTPFYIWANYDIEEKEIEKLSANYLSSLVLDTAGVKLTEYNKYLLELSETLPVINTVGYIDKDGNYYKWSDVSPYTELLNEYEKLQYNCIFDSENFNQNTFYLKGYTHTATNLEESED